MGIVIATGVDGVHYVLIRAPRYFVLVAKRKPRDVVITDELSKRIQECVM